MAQTQYNFDLPYTPPDFTRFIVRQTVEEVIRDRMNRVRESEGLAPDEIAHRVAMNDSYVLRFRVPEGDCLFEPGPGNCDVPLYSSPIEIKHSQIVLGSRIALLSSFAIEDGSLGVVLGGTLASLIENAEIVLGLGVSGPDFNRLSGVGQCVVEPADLEKDVAQVFVGFGQDRLEPQGFPELPDGLLRPAGQGERGAELRRRLAHAGFRGDYVLQVFLLVRLVSAVVPGLLFIAFGTERLRSFEVDHQKIFGRLLNRKVSGGFPF